MGDFGGVDCRRPGGGHLDAGNERPEQVHDPAKRDELVLRANQDTGGGGRSAMHCARRPGQLAGSKMKRRRGSLTVECALLLPVLFMLTFGLIEYGWMFL